MTKTRTRRRFRRRRPNSRAARYRRILIEPLETRNLLAAVTWDGGGGNLDWNNALNWSTDSLPGPDDDVTISNVGTVVLSGSVVEIKSLDLKTSLTVDSSQLVVTRNLTMSRGKQVAVDGSASRFVVNGSAIIDSAELTALNGSNIELPSYCQELWPGREASGGLLLQDSILKCASL